MMNRLDQVVKLLKEQLREIEQERRMLNKAEVRISRALAQFETNGVTHQPRMTRGPIRHDSNTIVLDAIAEHVEPNGMFTLAQAIRWGNSEYRPDDPLRGGQVKGAISELKKMGFIASSGHRGEYIYLKTEA